MTPTRPVLVAASRSDHPHHALARTWLMQALAHADAPIWLGELLQRERHVNVVGAAVDRLAEIGTADMLPLLDAVKCRFEGEPYIQFAIDTAIRRISGGPRAA